MLRTIKDSVKRLIRTMFDAGIKYGLKPILELPTGEGLVIKQ